MDITSLQVYKDAYASVLWVMELSNDFPKKFKYVLYDEILRSSVRMLNEVIFGCKTYDSRKKLEHFDEAGKLLESVDTMLLLGSSAQCITNKRLAEWMIKTNSIKRQLGGLINSLARRNGISHEPIPGDL